MGDSSGESQHRAIGSARYLRHGRASRADIGIDRTFIMLERAMTRPDVVSSPQSRIEAADCDDGRSA